MPPARTDEIWKIGLGHIYENISRSFTSPRETDKFTEIPADLITEDVKVRLAKGDGFSNLVDPNIVDTSAYSFVLYVHWSKPDGTDEHWEAIYVDQSVNSYEMINTIPAGYKVWFTALVMTAKAKTPAPGAPKPVYYPYPPGGAEDVLYIEVFKVSDGTVIYGVRIDGIIAVNQIQYGTDVSKTVDIAMAVGEEVDSVYAELPASTSRDIKSFVKWQITEGSYDMVQHDTTPGPLLIIEFYSNTTLVGSQEIEITSNEGESAEFTIPANVTRIKYRIKFKALQTGRLVLGIEHHLIIEYVT